MKLHVAVAALLFAPLAGAEPSDQEADFARSGIYLQLGAAGSFHTGLEDDSEDVISGVVDIDADTPAGVDFHGGYRLGRYVAAELNAQWFAAADIEVEGFRSYRLDTWNLTGGVKAYPLAGRYQPFGHVGVGVMQADLKGRGLLPDRKSLDVIFRFGGGLDIYITKHFAVVTEMSYVLPIGEVEGLDQITFGGGLMWRM
ncbi:MAG: porin family protein [bacterium]|nr:porin family protein [bacterium]